MYGRKWRDIDPLPQKQLTQKQNDWLGDDYDTNDGRDNATKTTMTMTMTMIIITIWEV